MNVRDIMTTEVVTVYLDTHVRETAQLMIQHHISGIPVVDAGGRFLGLVTEADLVAKQARVHLPVYLGILGGILTFESRTADEEIEHALATNAAQLMEKRVPTIAPTASVEDVATMMVDENASPIPVVEGGRLIGIVGRSDVVRLLLLEDDESISGSD